MKQKNFFILVFILIIGAWQLQSCNKNELKACFGYIQPSAVQTIINFNNCSENAVYYVWDFGDGGTSDEENPIHEYLKEGTYKVKLSVFGDGKDIDGETFEQVISVTLPEPYLKIKSDKNKISTEDSLQFTLEGYSASRILGITGYYYDTAGQSYLIYDSTFNRVNEGGTIDYSLIIPQSFYQSENISFKFFLKTSLENIESNSVEVKAFDGLNETLESEDFYIIRRNPFKAQYGYDFYFMKRRSQQDEIYMDISDNTPLESSQISGEIVPGLMNQMKYFLFPTGTKVEDISIQKIDGLKKDINLWTRSINVEVGSLFALYKGSSHSDYTVVEITEIVNTSDYMTSVIKFKIYYRSFY